MKLEVSWKTGVNPGGIRKKMDDEYDQDIKNIKFKIID